MTETIIAAIIGSAISLITTLLILLVKTLIIICTNPKIVVY